MMRKMNYKLDPSRQQTQAAQRVAENMIPTGIKPKTMLALSYYPLILRPPITEILSIMRQRHLNHNVNTSSHAISI